MTEEELRRLSPSHPAVVAYYNAKQAERRAKQLARMRDQGNVRGKEAFWRQLEGHHGK